MQMGEHSENAGLAAVSQVKPNRIGGHTAGRTPPDCGDQAVLATGGQRPSRQEAEKNWAAFQADPDWQKVKAESEVNGPLVDHIDRYFMDPTTFSALK